MRSLTVWSREGCGLCAELLDSLLPWAAARGVEVSVRELDGADAATQRRYLLEIPVVLHADRVVCRGHLDLASLERALAADGAMPATGRELAARAPPRRQRQTAD